MKQLTEEGPNAKAVLDPLMWSKRDLVGIYPPEVPGGRGLRWTHEIQWEAGGAFFPHNSNEEINDERQMK